MVSNLKDYVGVVIKLFEIKYNLIYMMFDFYLLKINT
jgi:hypothetical protein